jgi:outer membrane protein assembly factor BamA
MLAIIIGLFSFLPSAHDVEKHSFIAQTDTTARLNSPTPDSLKGFLQINRIFIIGNRITRDKIILRELSLKEGDVVYSADLPSILDLDRKKLINTRLFNKVDVRMLELDSGKIDLLVDLNERWYTFPSPIFELSDRNFNEWWQNYNHDFRRVNYGLRLYQFNMRGRNETLRFITQLGFQRRFELLYRFPYIDLRQKHGLTVEAGFLETKNLAVKTEDHKYKFLMAGHVLRTDRVAGLTYTYRRSFYQTHSLKLEYRNIHVADTVKSVNPDYIIGEGRLQQQYTWMSYQFTSDHRDFFAYPLKGYQLVTSITKTGLGAGDDVNKVEVNLLFSKYLDLTRKFFLSNNSIAYWSNRDKLAYSNYGVLGLKRQFARGYELYVVEGPYHFLNKTTFKKLIFSDNFHWGAMPIEQFRHIPVSIYLKTYADFAYVKNYEAYIRQDRNTRLSDTLLAGAGFGVDVVGSYDVVLRFEYSFNAQGERGFFFHMRKEF